MKCGQSVFAPISDHIHTNVHTLLVSPYTQSFSLLFFAESNQLCEIEKTLARKALEDVNWRFFWVDPWIDNLRYEFSEIGDTKYEPKRFH